jgi:Tfp pilus tip-associated adhesin PilY1
VTRGVDGGGAPVDFAPMAAPPAVVDYNDDGYLDAAYIGDVNGNMWRIDLTPDKTSSPKRGQILTGQAHGYVPFLLFDGCQLAAGTCTNKRPVFFEPGVVYVGGAGSPPVLGIAFGTGNRAELARPNTQSQDFFYVVDTGQTTKTFVKADLHDLTPPGGTPCPLPYTGVCANAANGFVLDYGTANEKTTSTVFSTRGYLSLITFTPDSVSPCATNGSSYRYRFFYQTGQGYYGTTGTYGDYQETLGTGMAAASQSVSPDGDTIDTTLTTSGGIDQDVTPNVIHTIEQNWKEQQQ